MKTKAKTVKKAVVKKAAPASNVIKNADGFPLLGWLVNYTTESGFSVGRDDLVAKLTAAQISDSMATDILPKNAAIRAVRAQSKQKDTFHRKVVDSDNVMAMVISSTSTDDKMNTTFNSLSKPVFDKATKELNVEGAFKEELSKEFTVRKNVYQSDQFRSIVLRYLKKECAAITYLESGSVYFVPYSKKEQLRKLQNLFASFNGSARIITKEEINTESIRKIMWEVTVVELKDDLESLEKDFLEYKDDDSITSRSLQVRLDRYNKLKTKAEMFSTVLQGSADELSNRVDSLAKAIASKVVL